MLLLNNFQWVYHNKWSQEVSSMGVELSEDGLVATPTTECEQIKHLNEIFPLLQYFVRW